MNSHDRRERREKRAIEIIKAIRRDAVEVPPHRQRHTALEGKTVAPSGVVYFIYCAGRVKIGFATDIVDRLSAISTHAPFPITLLLTIRGDMADERAFHERFKEARVNREWFDLSLSSDLAHFLETQLCHRGLFTLLDAQTESRTQLLSTVANVINLTGGDEDGHAVRGASWPGLLEVHVDHEEPNGVQ